MPTPTNNTYTRSGNRRIPNYTISDAGEAMGWIPYDQSIPLEWMQPAVPTMQSVGQNTMGDRSNAGFANRSQDRQANTNFWSTTSESPFSASNPFDEWWKGSVSAGAQVSSPNAGGSIWADALLEYGIGDVSAETYFNATDASGNTDWTGEVAVPQDEVEFNQPPPPGPISDTEWTTSPDDRRFLDTPAEETQSVDTSGGINFGGNSMSGFGGDLSLGSFLNTSLDSMRYGAGYPRTRGDGLMTGVVTAGGQVDMWGNQIDDVGGRWVERSDGSGSDWRENATASASGQGSGRDDGTGTTRIYRDDPIFDSGNDNTGTTIIHRDTPPTPPGMTIIGTDQQNGQPIYRDAQGNLFVNSGTGSTVYPTEQMFGNYSYLGQQLHQSVTARNPGFNYGYGQSASSAANDMLMSSQSGHNDKKIGMRVPDSGRNVFGTPTEGAGHIDRETGFLVRSAGGTLRNNPWKGWSYADQSADVKRTSAAKAQGFGRGLSRGG